MKQYDILVIGLGPAGMAVSAMASAMGKNVCVVEKNKLGGECLNVGCIPSKGLLEHARKAYISKRKSNPFKTIAADVTESRDGKTAKMFEKVDIIKAEAKFIDNNTIQAGEETISAKKIFISTGTEPFIPSIPGLEDINYRTNNNIFDFDKVPDSLVVIGGGAIGCEMAQAFSRLGTKVTLVQNEKHLLAHANIDASMELQTAFTKEGIEILNSRAIKEISEKDNFKIVMTDQETITADEILVATGRRFVNNEMGLKSIGIKLGKRGEIIVNKSLETNIKNIYAVGDCNGEVLLSHAAMHQGMIALMNSMSFIKQDFRKFNIPWTVFTDPQISQVGMVDKQLRAKGIKYKTTRVNYADYGAAIAEHKTTGFVKVYHSTLGKIYGAVVVGANSGELINEWTLAIENKIRLHRIMFMAHSFPTMGFLNKRIGEQWMMGLMDKPLVKLIMKLF